MAYLVGKREFYSLSFRVTPDVLIPRPETEFLLIRLLDLAKQQAVKSSEPAHCRRWHRQRHPGRLRRAKLAHSTVTAIDISPAALAVARENAKDHGVAEKIEFVESDLFASVPPDRQFDFVVSNPPYVKSSEMDQLMVDVRKFEPRLALGSRPAWTEVIERLIPQAAERLATGGWLLVEIGPAIEAEVRRLVQGQGAFELSPTIKDLAGHARVIQARRS